MELNKIEDKIACGEMSAAQVFTQMKQHLTERRKTMQHFNIYFIIQGPGGTIEAPNKYNPVEATDMQECLKLLSEILPDKLFGVKIIGVRIEEEKI